MKGRIYPNRGGFVVRFGKVSKWFKRLDMAERFLNGLRWETDQGKFDIREYQPDRPLLVKNLVEKYLEHKQRLIKHRSFTSIERFLGLAVDAWVGRSIKTIGYGEIEDLIGAQPVSAKTRSNMKSALHGFFAWLVRRDVIAIMPRFPQIKFELGWRAIVDLETQQAIISEVDRITHHINPKIGIGVRWLSIYIAIRPGELLNIEEGHISRSMGVIVIPHPKEGKPKIVPLTDADVELLETIPRGLPGLHFFRHGEGVSGATAGSRFGQRYLWKWWKKACDNLGITGVDLYGGTRHSTATALGKMLTPEQIKAGTMHSTNRAFERYFQRQTGEAKSVYQSATELQKTYTKNGTTGKDNPLIFKDKTGGGGGSRTR